MTSVTPEYAELLAAIAELRRQLAELRAPRAHTMRQTRRCPACGGTRILHFRHVHEGIHNNIVSLSLHKEHSVWAGVKNVTGPLEAFACRACRLVEWHAITLDDVEVDGIEVVELTAEAVPADTDEPYR